MPQHQQEGVGSKREIETGIVERGQITGEQTEDFKPSQQNEARITTNAHDGRGISARKLAANRYNAKKSTGPKSSQGKRNSSRNAIKHGILSKDVVVAVGDGGEDAAEFEALRQQLWDKYEPQDIQDELDVEELAAAYWRKRRALRAEMGSIRLSLDTIRADRSTRRAGGVDIDKMFLDLDDTKRNLLASPEGIDYLVCVVKEVEEEVQRRGYILENHPGFNILHHFGIQPAGLKKQEVIQQIASLKNELAERRLRSVQTDSLHLEAQIAAGALPSPEVTTNIVRYMTAIDRRIEQIRNRLDKRSERRAEKKDGTGGLTR